MAVDGHRATARASENPSTIAWALFAKGMATELTDVEHAEALFEDGLDRARSVENGWIGAMCSTRLASLRRRRGSWPDAMVLVAELLDTWDRAGHRAHLWAAIRQAALCLAEAGDEPAAVMLSQARRCSPSCGRPNSRSRPADDDGLPRSSAGVDGRRRVAALGVARACDLDLAAAMRLAAERMMSRCSAEPPRRLDASALRGAATTSASGTSVRSPVRRSFTSTTPSTRPRPTTTMVGMPSSSASLNFTPGDTPTRSSSSTRRPAASHSAASSFGGGQLRVGGLAGGHDVHVGGRHLARATPGPCRRSSARRWRPRRATRRCRTSPW